MNCYRLPGKTGLSTSNSCCGQQLAGITAGGAAAVGWVWCPGCTALPVLSIAAVPVLWEPPLPLGPLPFAPQGLCRLGSQGPVSSVTDLCRFPVPFLPLASAGSSMSPWLPRPSAAPGLPQGALALCSGLFKDSP